MTTEPTTPEAAHFPRVHWGRSFNSTAIEDRCPCPKAPCGLVDSYTVDPDCPDHPATRTKSVRANHAPADCPGEPHVPCPGTSEYGHGLTGRIVHWGCCGNGPAISRPGDHR